MADAKAANEDAFAKLCSKTSTDYPFTIERASAQSVNTKKISVLWPVLLSTLLALPSLVYAIIIALWRYATHSTKAETCEFAHADTPRNRLLVARLRKSLSTQPPPTNWCAHSGDLGTLVPFATFGEGAPVNWRRRWLRVARAPAPDGVDGFSRRGGKADDEAVALDVSLPDQPRDDAPVILVLHGLNGGSDEPYVRYLAQAAHERGSVCACLVARGLMATPVRASLFHGGRTSDVGSAVAVLKECFGDRVALIGISMGGIVAANYAARSGPQSNLVACCAVSATLCSEAVLGPIGDRARRLWHPPLTLELKKTFLGGPNAPLLYEKCSVDDIMATHTIAAFDAALVCPFNGYAAIDCEGGYYDDMSAAGRGDAEGFKRLANVRTPTFILHARDDPIVPFASCLPEACQKAGHVVLLATESGGHAGWPRSRRPTDHRWGFMHGLCLDFVDAAVATQPFKVDMNQGPVFDADFQIRPAYRAASNRGPLHQGAVRRAAAKAAARGPSS